ncbi:NAD-dependent epimerase/dehydratase family protein [Caulobacter hibisci]|uniref:SDR family oxidoreductase n=1 Tax=Caulobacter hibisci TaxID=2035993 RepID=A0ABS0SUK3_9CAUL|nr:SDR family oxidoreductase [Caulobacter hibisci]MBI1683291.1 SDR family oxidoreductase [Caulobacter hibisci]
MVRVLLVGTSGFIGAAYRLAAVGRGDGVVDLHYGADFGAVDFSGFDAVVNAACDPRYRVSAYDEALDVDLRLARALAASGAPATYYMLSSRKVYGAHAPFPATETAPIAPTDVYGVNKALTEAALSALPLAGLAVLRIANVYGDEVGRGSFFGAASRTLVQEGFVRLDISPFTRRDFIHVDDFACVLAELTAKKFTGVVNLGSGSSVELGRVALWLIEGFGSGRLICDSWEERDAFLLDSQKLKAWTSAHVGDVRSRCLEIGRNLKCKA